MRYQDHAGLIPVFYTVLDFTPQVLQLPLGHMLKHSDVSDLFVILGYNFQNNGFPNMIDAKTCPVKGLI